MKIPLERTKMPAWRNPKFVEFHIKSAEPFLRNKKAVLIHRVRSAFITGHEGQNQHMAVHNHCGQGVCGDGEKLVFVSRPEVDEIVCQRCEDLAIERGLPSSDSLAGRHVHTGGVKAYMNCCSKIEAREHALDELTQLGQEMGDYQFDDQDIASYAQDTFEKNR